MTLASVHFDRSTAALKTGKAKLWILLVGVNAYQDARLPTLRYCAIDCRGLGEALLDATWAFPKKEVKIYHDLTQQAPILSSVRADLEQIVAQAESQDTLLFYFSGHGLLEPESQQTVLCLTDTHKDQLLTTGLQLQEVLSLLNHCPAQNQIIWLDACHSGNLSLDSAKGSAKGDIDSLSDPTPQLLEVLRQRASKSKGFYALLSCDQNQKSWEFPDLGHGVFTYYLIQGLRGAAADSQGVIDADGLYRYVYYQTIHYIDRANQQLRFVNQQQLSRGEAYLQPEYSLQTPKRIVEGVGELILGVQPERHQVRSHRCGLVIEQATSAVISEFCNVLQKSGAFDLEHHNANEASVCDTIYHFLSQSVSTQFLYLQGQVQDSATGEAYLVLNETTKLSRSWLRQALRRAKATQQIVVLDCAGATSLNDWIEGLKLEFSQCLIVAGASIDEPELFAQVLLESLVSANPKAGLAAADWLPTLERNLVGLEIPALFYLSGAQGVIEVFPSKTSLEPKQAPSQSNSSNTIHLTADQHAQLTEILAEFIGPVAPTLLQHSLGQAQDARSLIDRLSAHLLPAQQWAFQDQIAPLLGKFTQADSGKNETSKSSELLTEEQRQHLEDILLELIGPIAPALLDRAIENVTHRRELIEKITFDLSVVERSNFLKQIEFLINRA